MKRIIFLLLAAVPFFVTGCASNPLTAAKEVQKEAPAPAVETKKEIIFPSPTEAFFVLVHRGDVKRARMEAVAVLVDEMKAKCQWTKPLNYYGDRVVIETKLDADIVSVRAHMDSSLCPEKN